MSINPTHAIVIGGSIAGMLNAAVLSKHFDQVTVIERDTLPEDNRHRAGVPQSHHLHTMLLRGYRIMEQLFPDFDQDVAGMGGIPARWGIDSVFLTERGWTPKFETTLYARIASRPTLEWVIRRRVQAIENIHFITEMDVKGLLTGDDQQRITGVRVKSRIDRTENDLYGDLIVDASGRRSKTPEWFAALGYDVPRKTVITAHTGYATRWYQLQENHRLMLAVITQPRARLGMYRGAGYLIMEGNQLVLTALGANGDIPPTDEEGYLAFLKSLPTDVFYQIATSAQPTSPIYGYRKLDNQIYHYEALKHRPENYIVTGDAACGFNPIYGQGMSTAAMEAEMLDQLLKGYNVRHLSGFAAKFQKRFYKLVQPPWKLSVTEDLRYPNVEGQAATWLERFMQKYFDYVVVAMPHDKAVTLRFFEVINLLKTPESFMQPDILARVIWHNLFNRRDSSQEINNPQIGQPGLNPP